MVKFTKTGLGMPEYNVVPDIVVSPLVFEWYERKDRIMLTPVTTLRVGKWNVGFVGYDYTSSAYNRGSKQVAYVGLPGLPQNQGNFGTVKEAKRSVEKAVTWWFYHCLNREAPAEPVKRVTRARPGNTPAVVRRTRTRDTVAPERVRRTRS